MSWLGIGWLDVVAVKKALIGVAAALADGGPLDGVQVAYSWPGRGTERECVHGGLTTWETSPAGLDTGDDVTVTTEVHIVVAEPGATVQETDERAADLATALAACLADDQTLGGHPGVLSVSVEGGDLYHETNDDGAATALTMRVRIGCYQQ